MKQVAAVLRSSSIRRSLVLGLCLALAVPSFAQRGGGGGGGRGGGGGGRPGAGGNPGGGPRGPGAGGNPYNLGPPPASAGVNSSVPGFGFGSALFPGGSTSFGSSYVSPIYSTQAPLNNTFASTLGRVVGGVSPTSGFIGGNNRPRGRGGIYPVPVFVGGGYGYGYGNGYDSPQVTIINAQPAVPSVIINQGYEPDAPARPVMRVYGGGATNTGVSTIQIPSPSYPEGNPIQAGSIGFGNTASAPNAASEEPNVYMIALRDGTIYASYAYWTERDMLHYITPGHAHNQVSMDRVDLTLTRRLNRERNLDFNLR